MVLAIFPVTILKNGLRVVTIYWLSIHQSMGSLTVWMHRFGGIPFSFLGLALLAFLVISLRRFEETSTGSWWIIVAGDGFEKKRQTSPST